MPLFGGKSIFLYDNSLWRLFELNDACCIKSKKSLTAGQASNTISTFY